MPHPFLPFLALRVHSKRSNLCRLTCHSLSSDRPDSGKNLRGHDDHGVLPAEQNQALAGPPRRAGTAVRWVALCLSLAASDPFKVKRWPTHSPKTPGLFLSFFFPSFCHCGPHPRKSPHFTWEGGREGKACRGRQKTFLQIRLASQDAILPSAGQSENFPSSLKQCSLLDVTQTQLTK